ncbi:MAG: glycosyltransferase family 4 protein [Rhodospirillales bacterium]|nr:glycosyltransferase family 4 protein [Rhodospirillales bacterium]
MTAGPWVKMALRSAYRTGLGLHERLSAASSGNDGAIRVFYGGARGGTAGGTRVKISRLGEVFPEHVWDYTLVYLLSNAPYLSPAALERLKARGIPIVGNQDGVFYPGWFGGDWRAENERMAAPHRLADHVFYQSEFCRRAATAFLGERTAAEEVLYNAVDASRFVPAGKDELHRDGHQFLVAGKFGCDRYYRLESAVRGLAHATRRGLNARLTVAGIVSRGIRARVLALAQSLNVGNAIRLAGPYDRAAAPRVFASADVFLSTGHNDPCPSSVIEAMACGLPVIYAASGGVPELVGSEAGVAVETGESWDEALSPSPDGLADAMAHAVENHAAFSAAARSRALARFDIGPWLDRHRQIFRSLLEARHG